MYTRLAWACMYSEWSRSKPKPAQTRINSRNRTNPGARFLNTAAIAVNVYNWQYHSLSVGHPTPTKLYIRSPKTADSCVMPVAEKNCPDQFTDTLSVMREFIMSGSTGVSGSRMLVTRTVRLEAIHLRGRYIRSLGVLMDDCAWPRSR